MIRRIILASLVIAGSFFFGAPAFAQVTDDVAVSIAPANPGPRETVNISLSSFSVDVQSADIVWIIDGKTALAGVGATRYSFTTKALGAATTIKILVTPVGAPQVTKEITITPMSVDILWQATDSSVPPFYRGKAMPTSESNIKFTAIPNIQSARGVILPADSFIYDWQENYTPNQSFSGFAKDSFDARMTYLKPNKHIGVQVSSRDGGSVASAELNISPVSPKIVWYASSPLYGPIFDMALSGAYNVSGADTSVYVQPYFFAPGNAASRALTYEWSINNQPIATPAIPNSLFLQKDIASTGTANINLSVKNLGLLFQEASSQLTLYLN